MGQEMDTVRDYIRALNDSDPTNIYVDEKEALSFLFEYACQTLEYEGYSPSGYLSPHIPFIMETHLENIIERAMIKYHNFSGKKKVCFPDRSVIPFFVDQDHATQFDPSKEYQFSKKEIAKNNKRNIGSYGNPQIEIAYFKLEETGVTFDRSQLEKWCFEVASRNLEKEDKQKIQSNYDQQILRHLTAIILEADILPNKIRKIAYLVPSDDYMKVSLCINNSREKI